MVLIVSGLFTVHAVNRGTLATLGAPGVWVGSVFDGWMGVTTRTEDGTKVSYQDQHHMGVTDTGVLFAPKPVRQFRGATVTLPHGTVGTRCGAWGTARGLPMV